MFWRFGMILRISLFTPAGETDLIILDKLIFSPFHETRLTVFKLLSKEIEASK